MPRVNRIGLVPVSQPGEAVRRYRLARLEDVSLATPVSGSLPRRDGVRLDTVSSDGAPISARGRYPSAPG
jgi:hypothetical protein